MEREGVAASSPISTEENKMESTIEGRNQKYIKAAGIDEPATPRENMTDVMTQIDGGIVDYVRQRMGFERVTREVYRQAVAFENEMSRMQGW